MISVVIATCNDPRIHDTVSSIRATSDSKAVEVLVVDDCSAAKLHVPEADRVIRNRFRCGCGVSRHIGVLNACMDWVLLCDGHMQFPFDWYQAGREAISLGGDKSIWCYASAVLDAAHQTLASSGASYWNGATINLYGPDSKFPKNKQVLEPKWSSREVAHGDEVPCLLGAAYLMRKDFFLHLAALRFLRFWGSDEVMLSVKAWLAGGQVRMLKKCAIGHYYYSEHERQGFSVKQGYPMFNKMFTAHTLMPPELAETLVARMRLAYDRGDYVRAIEMVKENWHLIEQEQSRNALIFSRTFQQYVERFGIPLPGPTA